MGKTCSLVLQYNTGGLVFIGIATFQKVVILNTEQYQKIQTNHLQKRFSLKLLMKNK